METLYDIERIKTIIPHRYPFLMIDKIVELVPAKYAIGIKNVTSNEFFFPGHFPNRPIMPGVLILEAIAQTAAVFAKESDIGVEPDYYMYLVGASSFKWKRQVVPGDTLHLRVELAKRKKPMIIVDGKAFVNGDLVASGTLSAAEGQ